MKTHHDQRRLLLGGIVVAVGVMLCSSAFGQGISGNAVNRSTWTDGDPALSPPGDGDGNGDLVVGAWAFNSTIAGPPLASATATSGGLPFTYGAAYAFAVGLPTGGSYQVVAWIDGDSNGEYDLGEPRSETSSFLAPDTGSVVGVSLVVLDSQDNDDLPDWWEAHWFRNAVNPLGYDDEDDPDGDGLTNQEEYQIAIAGLGMDLMNPANWDTDGDAMDDYWEWMFYYQAQAIGTDPTASNRVEDIDGDGLSSIQEYCGVDGQPRMIFNGFVNGVIVGRLTSFTPDDLNPLDIDTDFDLLIDSFEAAWYDSSSAIDPKNGVLEGEAGTAIAVGDPDGDGLTSYREMSLLASFREGGANEDKWMWENVAPFPQQTYYADTSEEEEVRVCLMSSSGVDLNLGLVMDQIIPATTNRHNLRNHEWTDPSPSTSYNYPDENIPSGWDTDGDLLPDGWEVQFNIDPRDAGMSAPWDNGAFGDPDGDGIFNIDEYFGPDGQRSSTFPYINGSGDETNPNEYNHRPDSTYEWRWLSTNAPHSDRVNPRPGLGINRSETLGSALPTASLGTDSGTDSDDDGTSDLDEIWTTKTSPVHSSDPFIRRAVLIDDAAGIVFPDPEPEAGGGLVPAGIREDLQRRDWTIECHVKLLDTGLSGYLFNFQTRLGPLGQIVYRLELTNNVPALRAQFGNSFIEVVQAKALPTNRWVHLAGVWDSKNNALSLYVDGILSISKTGLGESPGRWIYPATNTLALAVSPDSSFVGNLLLDEVRIWGLARSAQQIDRYAKRLVPQGLADDAWIDVTFDTSGNLFSRRTQYPDFVLVNGGSLFEGEEGAVLTNVLMSYRTDVAVPPRGLFNENESVWVDNGDGVFRSVDDTILWDNGSLKEGELGTQLKFIYFDNVPARVLYSDKDSSGGFTRNPLLAYYRFDDGGSSVEDFARKAKSSLTGVYAEDYAFGDRGYALPTNNFLWVTNEYAPTYGATTSGADDSDGDGMPDAWEIMVGLDPYDDGTVQETAPGARNGPSGAKGDPDADSLMNVYEYWSGTNPRDLSGDSDGNAVPDTQEDLDGDGVANIVEQELGSRPDLVDTDDDALTDGEEYSIGTNPADGTDPSLARAVELGGSAADYLEVPINLSQRLLEWTIEAWVKPASVVGGQGTIVRRVVEQLGGGTNAMNYIVGLESDGLGGLRIYAGYTLASGKELVVRGGSVPTGIWTHVSATYSNATLVIYTNGAVTVSSNSAQFVSPPVNGKGGDTFLRMGEGFEGRIDEVRIWSGGRTPSAIETSWFKTVPRTSVGLAHYFRFDDGQAITNTLPFGPYHQPAGAQDFTYTNDWNQHWRHAAVLRGNSAFVEPDGILGPPSLRVIINPPEAITAGAQWSLDGGTWQDGGATLYDLTPGAHIVTYKAITGWDEPDADAVSLSNGTPVVISRTYRRNGALTITIQPSEIGTPFRPIWSVDGGAPYVSGAVATDLTPADHLVQYVEVGGWIAPTFENVAIPEGTTVSLTRVYSPNVGYLRVNLNPPAAVIDGAQWNADGGLWYNSGAVLALGVGSHSVGYRDITGWIPPGTDTVTIAYGTTTTLSRAYTANPSEDSDGDGLPDWWEILYGLDPEDATGVNGADGDPDSDGLRNLYEYWSGTDPQQEDTNGDGRPDGEEDADGDNVSNYNEQQLGTRPDRDDTDDDGWTDGDELDFTVVKTDEWRGRRITSPTYSRSPLRQRSMLLDGVPVTVQDNNNLAKTDWTIDCWFMPTNTTTGYIVRRLTDTGQTNYSLRIDANVPSAEFTTGAGVRYRVGGNAAVPVDAWTRLTATYKAGTRSLELVINNVLAQAQTVPVDPARGDGVVDIGAGLQGYLDNLSITDPAQAFDIVFVLDVSGSMEGEKLGQLKAAASDAIDLLAEGTPVGIVSFSDTAQQLTTGFTTDKTALKGIVANLEAGGGTAYSPALAQALDLVERFSVSENHIEIFISDGEPGDSPSDSEILQSADAGIVINTIGFQLSNPAELQRLSNLTGGKFYNAPSQAELQEALGEIAGGSVFNVQYLFDDDAVTAEDFKHLLNWDYALTNVTFETDVYVETDITDGDGDGLPDWWETMFGFDPAVPTDEDGAYGDVDGDGLVNLYEYWSDTNPRNPDTDNDGRQDGDEDYDGDGLSNYDEQVHGSDPRLPDTDDDGIDDVIEKEDGTSPASSLSPLRLQALVLGGAAGDYVEMPYETRFALNDFTIEAWVRPAAGWGGGGYVLRRNVQPGMTNYFLSVDGALRPMAGFDTEFRVTAASPITADGATWTHLAATYESGAQILRLFVNGAQVGSRVCSRNPQGNGVGPLVQRIGESFNGALNEVRIWNIVRSPANIAAAMSTTLSGREAGLVAYYRFDDNTRWTASPLVGTSGNNLTNGSPDASIHAWRWGQVEDFSLNHVTNDWLMRWRRSATINGTVGFTGLVSGVVAPLPAVRIMLAPEGAVSAGAQWSVNGGAWQNSGAVVTLEDTNALTINLGYKSIQGYAKPDNETVTVSNNVTTTFTRYYQKNGTLTVHLEPGAISNAAAFSVDGGEFFPGGTTVSNLSPGTHNVSYKGVSGWDQPADEGVAIGEDEDVEITRFYVFSDGSLTVNIEPLAARLAGAEWTIDGTNYYGSGFLLTLHTGTYTVAFQDIAAWDTPADVTMVITPALATNVTATYVANPTKDSDGDGMPDSWEVANSLDPFDATGINGATGDPDDDELWNIYEYWSGTDPWDPDTDDNGALDPDEDADSDGLTNGQEQDIGSRPDQTDTDDDGWSDGDEVDVDILKPDMWRGRRITSPVYSRAPWVQRGMMLTGAPVRASTTVEAYLNRTEWMIDLWYRPTNATTSGKLISRVTTQGLTNFCMRLANNVPSIEFQTPGGVRQQLVGGAPLAANEWAHLTASWKPETMALELTVNEMSYQAQLLVSVCARGTGVVEIGSTGLGGYLDNVMVRNPSPQDVIFVLDVSGSMFGEPLANLKTAAKLAVDLLPQDTPIALVTFSTSATNLTRGFTQDRAWLKQMIDSLQANGETYYNRALSELTNTVSKYSTYDRHLALFLSDGAPTESPTTDDILAVKGRQIVIDTIGFGSFDASELQRMSDLTGGKYYDAPTSADLQTAFASILSALYKVRYVFDDAGATSEDVDHPLNWAYALSNAVLSATQYVDLVFTDEINLGLPNWWEEFFFGADAEPWGDPDNDGLANIYEYWCDTHPLNRDTDEDGRLDGDEDYDGDGLVNTDEQLHGTDPRLTDTDDDGISDLDEKLNGTAGTSALSPLQPRAMRFGGAASDYVEMPRERRFGLTGWTVEAWVNPSSGWAGNGMVLRRVVETGVTNFFLSVDGSRRPQAGFGSHRVADTVALTADGATWTHLAATYDDISQELLLYVNGASVASTVCSENPRTSGSGPLVQRIGEGWNGLIDEVRIWNFPRSPQSILGSMSNALVGAEDGLTAYYRFDDGTRWEGHPTTVGTSGNNVTNGASATDPAIAPWWWGQVEDFAEIYGAKDWSNRWKHAATIYGNVAFSNTAGAVLPLPSIRVLLNPAGAVATGAKWSLNGGAWRDSGDVVSLSGTNLDATIGYRSIYDWTAPDMEVVAVTNGQSLTLTRYYQRNGTLMISIEPMGASSNGARWRVDGGAWQGSDATVSNLAPGAHSVEFMPVAGWSEPPMEEVLIGEGERVELTRFYVAGLGGLIINLGPPAAVAAGAQWNVDGGTWQTNGTLLILAVGTHDITYRTIPTYLAPSNETISIIVGTTTTLTRVYVTDPQTDTDSDGLPDAWEVFWFGNLEQGPEDDPDHDGLTNLEEYRASALYAALTLLNPLNFDSDFDGMDDKWEYERFLNGNGLNPMSDDAAGDLDGDGILNIQEYFGLDGLPRIMQDPTQAAGIAMTNIVSTNSLNPINLDTDNDGLVDSFEAAWYREGVISPLTHEGWTVDADPDEDGLSNFREMCLLAQFRQSGVNDLWSFGPESLPATDTNGIRAFVPPLLLDATNAPTIAGVRADLQNHAWTDPLDADTDEDLLPDGWELEFNLDPRSSIGVDGYWGDPDGDGRPNVEEYLGQDGNRGTNLVHVNGSGDETNPNEHNWRPDSTGAGPGIRRPVVSNDYWYYYGASPTSGTMGAALPTVSLGTDFGLDTDDDGIADQDEIQQEYLMGTYGGPSPVHSMSPFIKRAAQITAAAGIAIPDPEGGVLTGYRPTLHTRSWTIEAHVKLMATNMTGYIVDNPGPWGVGEASYRLSLSNNVPTVSFHTLGGFLYEVTGPRLPTNRWVHLAGVWDHANNSLSLYVDGIFLQARRVMEESLSYRLYPSALQPRLAASDGSFVNNMYLDEVRIWNRARTSDEIEAYRRKLVPQDDQGLLAYYRFDDGGLTAEDFARKAQSSLLGVARPYAFGDHGYALDTSAFAFVTNEYAEVFGVDPRGADDTDGDGMPDDWEIINNLDPYSAEGDNGAKGDPDGDGLWNIYEYWSGTNPNAADTEGDGALDVNEDRDGDGVPNLVEQQLGSRPDLIDTDDDGVSDGAEHRNGTNPVDPTDPLISRSMEFGGGVGDYLEVPISFSQRLMDWTLEAWVRPSAVVGSRATIIRRVVQDLGGGNQAVNWVLGIEPDGGGMRFFAGYVTPDGSEHFMTFGAAQVGQWIHVGASYNSLKATISTYTNGVLAHATNTFTASPPMNGRGGETFVRIGERFPGLIDEVRVWSDPRSDEEMLANYYEYIEYDSPNLVHYFRFDDSEANTTEFPFGEYHQPFGAQDFVYPTDWEDEWIHAAFMRGTSGFSTNGAIEPPPSIRVILQPAEAVAAGAQWALDSGAWLDSGETVRNLDRINLQHSITYRSVPGWSAPSNEVVTVTNGVTTVLTRTYVRRGSLTVNIEPPEVPTAALQLLQHDYLWSIGNYGEGQVINDLIYHRDGETVTNLPIGTYTLRFLAVPGWNPPASRSVSITEGAAVVEVGTYTPIEAMVRVFIEPQGVIDDGAQWRVDSGPWQNSGEYSAPLDYGPHTVQFLPTLPWITPASQPFSVTNDQTVVLTGQYFEATGLYVEIEPAAARAAGALWRVAGGNWTNSGVLLQTGPGTYTVEFLTLPNWATPAPQTVQVLTNSTASVLGYYYQYEVIPTNVIGLFNKPMGLAFDSQRRLYVADSGNHRIVRYDTRTGSLTYYGGPTASNTLGMFNQPFAVALDRSDNLYVADAHNHRIQRRSAQTGTWTAWGGPSSGTGLGQFNTPFDLALDAQTNLYVTDHYNHRVQKRTAAGVWSVFLTNGFANGLVRFPGGVEVDPSNRVIVTDWPTTARVQLVSASGAFIEVIGSPHLNLGELERPYRMDFGFTNDLFIADWGKQEVVRRTASNGWDTIIGGDALTRPEGVAWEDRGYLYIADTGSNRVIRVLVQPLSSEIPPTIGGLVPGPGGMQVSWQGALGWFYTVQYTDTGVDPWFNVSGGVLLPGYDGVMTCTDTNNMGIPTRIYRVLYY